MNSIKQTLAFAAVTGILGAAGTASAHTDALAPWTRFASRAPDSGFFTQVDWLVKHRNVLAAVELTDMVLTPQSTWLNGGTPCEVQQTVEKTILDARLSRTTPVFTLYDIPYRDCAGYSAGGATDTAAYEAWIDGVAAGIGHDQAVVVLEPDSLGIIPWVGDGQCQPTVTDPTTGDQVPAPEADPAHRYAQLQYAVSTIHAHSPRSLVYLDGTHSAWLNVGDVSYRLILAGVADANGFFLNVSNFQFTANGVDYGTWISECIALANPSDLVHSTAGCVNQYWNGGPVDVGWGEWNGVALSPLGQWSDTSTEQDLNTYDINYLYAQSLSGAGVTATTHFIIDTSRNGNGPMNATVYGAAPYDQSASTVTTLGAGNWCNPPSAGLGVKPTASTGDGLVDAYLWVKTPGESDGSCDIAGGARAWDYSLYNPWGIPSANQDLFDPLWGAYDPNAGLWFSGRGAGTCAAG